MIADGLDTSRDPEKVDLVVGNPPFLSQTRSGTARNKERRVALAERFGPLAAGYVDDAALFLMQAVGTCVGPLGEVVMIVPESLLGTDSASRVREAIDAIADVEVVWRDDSRAFPGTPTCALRLTRSAKAPGHPGHWSGLLLEGSADDLDDAVLLSDTTTGSVIGDVTTATADFRDAYYRLATHVAEASATPSDEQHPIVPVGLIDPAHLRWGEASVRFAKRRWERPVAEGLPATFVHRRLGPKILVATQTKVLEALVDDAGVLLPSTPVITLRTDRLWYVGAALTSPVLSRLALIRHAGAGRSRGALKLSARQVLQLPLPSTDDAERADAWDSAATAFRDAHAATDPGARRALLQTCGERMMVAYGVGQPRLLDWWLDRLPDRGTPRPTV